MRPLVRFAPAVLFFVCLLVDCKSLPSLTPGTCGNGVVDPATEECDTYPVGQCNPPGSPNQCRLDCTAGTGHTCPAGWGCGVDNVCRQPSGQFVQVGEPIPAGAWRLLTGDIDGDGRQDVIARTQPSGDLQSRLRVHFFDDGAQLAQQVVVPPALGLPLLRDIDGDGMADLSFTLVQSVQENTTGMGVLLGQSDRTLAPVSYPSIQNPGSFARVGLFGEGQDGLIAVLASAPGGGAVLGQVEGANIVLANTLLLRGKDSADTFANVAIARFDEGSGSCGSMAFAFPTDAYAYVVPVCTVDVGTGGQTWNPTIVDTFNTNPSAFQVALPRGYTVPVLQQDPVARVFVPNGVLAADVNGDGHQDLLIASAKPTILPAKPTESIAFVAYGDGHGNFSPTTQLGLPIPTIGEIPYFTQGCAPNGGSGYFCTTFPLAAGDFTGDGVTDFVTANYVLGSVTTEVDGGVGNTQFYPLETNLSRFWSEAVVHDLNGDGFPDIAIATYSEVDIDFYSGTNTIDLNPFTIVTNGPPHQFATGDFDGDFIGDLAFAESTGSGDEIAIAYGQLLGSPTDPVATASLPVVTQTVGTPVLLTEVQTLVAVGQLNATTNAVLLLPGNGDRLPLAALPQLVYPNPPVACSTTSLAGPYCAAGTSCVGGGCGTTGLPLGLATGRFRPTPAGTTPPLVDEIAMTYVPLSQTTSQYRLWANLASPDPSFGATVYSQELSSLGWSIGTNQSAALMDAAPLDASGLDSLVVVTTGLDAKGTEAATSTVRVVTLPASVTSQSPPSLDWIPNVTFQADLPLRVNPSASLRLFDGNGDGSVDIFVLPRFDTTQRGAVEVLWNNQGTFDAGATTALTFPGMPADGPDDFAPVQDAPGAPLAIAVVSNRFGVGVAHLDPASHAVTSVTMVDAARHAIGISAADVNGDGFQDLVVGDTVGNLVVYRGKPVLQ